MRGLAHALLATGGDNVGVTTGDLLHTERHGAKAGAAQLVHAPGRAFGGDTGIDGSLAGGVLAGTGGEHLAEDHLVDVGTLQPGPLHGSFQRHGAKCRGSETGQCAIERSNRRPCCRDDDDPIT